ncbi:putative protein O-GlcNAc transferase [Helianthus debilis subsp. tardiflorus]
MNPEIDMNWCDILKRVPNSALWLLRFPSTSEIFNPLFTNANGIASRNQNYNPHKIRYAKSLIF